MNAMFFKHAIQYLIFIIIISAGAAVTSLLDTLEVSATCPLDLQTLAMTNSQASGLLAATSV
jgi:hypothetical protein